jgi:hypothetical protein
VGEAIVKKLLMVAVFSLVVAGLFAESVAGSGPWLRDLWAAYSKIMATKDWDKLPAVDILVAGEYAGYVMGVSDACTLSGLIKYPEPVEYRQLSNLVGLYLGKHPKDIRDAEKLVIDALREAYP